MADLEKIKSKIDEVGEKPAKVDAVALIHDIYLTSRDLIIALRSRNRSETESRANNLTNKLLIDPEDYRTLATDNEAYNHLNLVHLFTQRAIDTSISLVNTNISLGIENVLREIHRFEGIILFLTLIVVLDLVLKALHLI